MSVGLLPAIAADLDARADRLAIEDRGRPCSYAQLWAWAAAVGAWLGARGVGRGDLVALELDKSAEYVAGMLGCWWIGAAFLPAPTELPSERRRWILAEAAPKLGLDHASLAGLRPPADAPVPATTPVEPRPEELAYVVYTSGSSGQPKGVRVGHAGLVPLLRAQAEAFAVGPTTRTLSHLSLTFDAAISDIGVALYAGAPLVIVARERLTTPEALLATLAEARIAYADLPPALLAQLDADRLPACVETLVIGGEVCPAPVVRRFASRVRLVNVYGPTEATICASLIRCDPARWDRPSIGAPLPGWAFRVVDGELWIGGVGVALGYQPRADGRDPDPGRFVVVDGQRWFRTGDRVRVSADGSYEFRGRLDRQRKLGGVRIELDEIEAWLAEHPDVREAAVVELPGAPLTAAFVARRPGLSAASLREHLRARLPGPAIPRRFVELDGLPRGATAKLDRAALAAALAERAAAIELEADAPTRAPVATLLAALWRRVLGVDPRVALSDEGDGPGFVALGGDSLAALELVAAAAAHGLRVSAARLLADASFAATLAAVHADAHERRSSASLELEVHAASVRAGLDLAAQPAQRTRSDSEDRAPLAADATLLITGATGFVGRHLVAAIRARHRGRLICLVRGRDRGEAEARLARAVDEAAATLGLAAADLAQAPLEVVLGELGPAALGLAPASWDRLAAEVDGIVHGGAQVHLGLGFEALRPSNLDGTAAIVALAGATRAKRLDYLSTLSVFVAATPAVPEPGEDDPLTAAVELRGGYAQSKWAAERLVRARAPELGVAATIHRLGLITGDTRTGRGPAGEQLGLVVRGLAELGAIPAGHERLRVDVTPVDYASEALAELILAGPAAAPGRPSCYHLASPAGATAAELVAALARAGRPLATIDAAAWRRLGERLPERSPAAAIAYLAVSRCVPEAAAEAEVLRTYDLFQSTGFRFACERAQARLGPAGIACPPADAALLDRYVAAALAGVGGSPS